MRSVPALASLALLSLLAAPVARAAAPAAPVAPKAAETVLAVAENGLPRVEFASFTAAATGETPFAVGVWPATPLQGALLVVDVAAPRIRTAGGSFGGKPLRFHRIDAGTLRGVAPVPHDAKAGPATLALRVTVGEGKARRKYERTLPLAIAPVDYPRDQLRVDPKFTKLSAAARKQIAADRIRLAAVWKASPDRPLFTASFAKPREDRTTAPYGTRRTFNGAVKSVHAGWDIDGDVGDEVLCTNDGIVRLAGDLYYSGGTMIVDHGAGIFSVYMHLSDYLVKEGERVTRGQPCAKVGDTGRVTGPHLHFGVKVGGSYVHPEALLRFEIERPLAAYPGGTRLPAGAVVPAIGTPGEGREPLPAK